MKAATWTLTIRAGSRVDHEQFDSLAAALEALERNAAALAEDATREPVQFFGRRIDPVRQVAARLELAGPGARGRQLRGGVDLRGDGSLEAFTGRVRRTVVATHADESVPAALARALAT